ncbi:MAG TPA: hypothetical protein VLB49_08485 [Gemmatimonadales bacterium]|nr:hypothetical protein [Gemmatimonadales bacterium]
MDTMIVIVRSATAALVVLGVGQAKAAVDTAPPFAVASVFFEQNATDRDVEVVFDVKGGDDGLVQLTVVAPDGRTVVDIKSPDASTLGLRQFRFESPERGNVGSIKAAYPEGVYTFDAVTAAGAKFHGTSRLSHTLPAPATGVRPAADATGVPVNGLTVTWSPVRNLAGYVIGIEQEDLGVSVTAKLPGSATSFAVPDGFLVPGREYVLSIGTMTGEGNASYVESTFTTAGAP